jgi:putative membrane protein
MIWSEKLIFRIITSATAVVLLLVIVLHNKWLHAPINPPYFTRYLPLLNAIINGICTLLLLLSLYFIKNKKVAIHKKLNLATFILSSIFLASYILYHFFQKETKFPMSNPVRPIYLSLLVSHILLAGLVLPLILFSFYYALTSDFITHRKIVRWTYPFWLYVTITGVIVYWMISPYYKF